MDVRQELVEGIKEVFLLESRGLARRGENGS